MRKLNLDEQQVLVSYAQSKSAQKVADEFGCSYQSIYRILHKYGVRRRKSKKQVKHLLPCGSKKCCPLAVVLLRKYSGMKPSAIATLLGYTPNAVNSIISSRCPETIVRKHKQDFDIEQMVHEYRDLGTTSYELAQRHGVNPATIRKWMRDAGVVIGRENAPHRVTCRGRGQDVLKDRCKERVRKKLIDDGDTLELVAYGDKLTLRCKICGHEFEKSKGGYSHRFTCPACHDAEMRAIQEQKEQKKLEKAQQKEAAREWLLSTPRVCKECGDPFFSESDSACYCSDACRNKSRNRKATARKSRRGSTQGYRHRMRIEITRETYDRTVNTAAVNKKFGGVCCQCGRKTFRTKDYTPLQATLDHVVALANNGTHTWDNVQLLCAECNSNKRDLGQMRLPIAI